MSMVNFADCELASDLASRPVMWRFEVSRNKKGSDCSEPFREFNPGGDLRSRAVTRAVSSAQQGLTSVFGMGTGVTLAIRPPGKSGSLRLEARGWKNQPASKPTLHQIQNLELNRRLQLRASSVQRPEST